MALVLAIITVSAGVVFATPLVAYMWPDTAAGLLTVNAAARRLAGTLMIGIPVGVCCALLMSILSGALRGGRVSVAAAVVALIALALFGSVAWGYLPQP